MKYMSPEERLVMEKTKMKVKQHFVKFFRYCAIKKNSIYFLKWRASIQLTLNREREFAVFKKLLVKKKNFKKKLRDEKDK